MIDKYFSNNPGTNNILKCLFANGNCSATRDPVSPDNTSDTVTSGEKLDSTDESTIGDATSKDSNGNVTTENLGAAEQNIGTRPFFWCMHEQPVFQSMGLFKGESHPHAERIARNGFYLPSGLGLTDADVDTVIDTFKKVVA